MIQYLQRRTALLCGLLMLAALMPAYAQTAERSCAWLLKDDPSLLNIFYPDFDAHYWLAVLPLPPGGSIELRGRYPHARYMSFHTYGIDTGPVDALADIDIAPDAGSANPFEAGADRTDEARGYTVNVVAGGVPEQRAANTLYATPLSGTAFTALGLPSPLAVLMYRVYIADADTDVLGGTGVPDVAVVLPGGQRIEPPALCAMLDQIDVPAVLNDLWIGQDPLPSARPANGVTDPVEWIKFLNVVYSFTGSAAPESGGLVDPVQSGGFWSNLQNAYIYTGADQYFGEALVIEGLAPRTPRTRDGAATMPAADLRYWSYCIGQSNTTRTLACVSDEDVPIDADGRYTIVVSGPERRPANATPECGVAWLPWGLDSKSRIILRHMLPDPAFPYAIQRIENPPTVAGTAATMGPYLPHGYHTSQADFESRGCKATVPARDDAADGAGATSTGAGSVGVYALLVLSLALLARRRRVLGAWALAAGLAACQGSDPGASAQGGPGRNTDAPPPAADGNAGCGWLARVDPTTVNLIYPDTNALYWIAALPRPTDAIQIEIRGQYPWARYFSYTLYDGTQFEWIADAEIAPAAAQAANPYLPGADRDGAPRDYVLRIVGGDVPADGTAPNTLYFDRTDRGLLRDLPQRPAAYLVYRLYIPDADVDELGGVSLPTIHYLLGDQVLSVPDLVDCEALRALLELGIYGALADSDLAQGAPPAGQETNPPTWVPTTSVWQNLLGSNADLLPPQFDGGFAANPHNEYMTARLNTGYGPIAVVRGQMPLAPLDLAAHSVMPTDVDLRYWSVCTYHIATIGLGCLSDEQIEPDNFVAAEPWYSVVVSHPDARPPAAVNWLPWGPGSSTRLFFRHMLPGARFYPRSIGALIDDGVLDPQEIRERMGPYFPATAYCDGSQFAQDRCRAAFEAAGYALAWE